MDWTVESEKQPIGPLIRIMQRAEVFVSGPYWVVEVCFLAVLFSVLFIGGVDESLYDMRVKYPSGYMLKIAHPLADVGKGYPSEMHDAKLNFRLTVPVLLHVLRAPVTTEAWILPGLTACAICGILVTCCLIAFRVTGDRVCGLFITLGVASTYIGSFATTRYYDAIAILQLVLAMLPRLHWSVRAFLVFSACFTDERAFVAAGLLLVHFLFFAPDQGPASKAQRVSPAFLALGSGIAAYGIGRFLLTKFAGLTTPMGGTGLEVLVNNARYWHSGVWLALGGGWLLVTMAMLNLWREKQLLALSGFVCAITAPILVGLMVQDVLRSTAYALPAIIIALTILIQKVTIAQLRVCCLAAFVLSAVAGDFYIFPNPWVTQPLAIKWLSQALSLLQ